MPSAGVGASGTMRSAGSDVSTIQSSSRSRSASNGPAYAGSVAKLRIVRIVFQIV